MSSIQINIKRQLQAKSMSAAELERRTGIPHAVVNILHGRSKNPSLKTVQAIAKELDCSLEELLAESTNAIAALPSKTKQEWQPEIYSKVFESVFQTVDRLKLATNPTQFATWLTEVYDYTLGSPTRTVDSRFVEWLLTR